MRLYRFEVLGGGSGVRVGAEAADGSLVDLGACGILGDGEGMADILAGWPAKRSLIEAAVASKKHRYAQDAVRLLAPIVGSEKVLCVGMNYKEHCTEQNFPIPTEPLIFNKFSSSIAATGDTIPFDSRF